LKTKPKMDLKKYDKLRQKINTKDFEGNNRGLDKWLFRFSFVGNASSIFFAYFLVFPSLLKAISVNFLTGNWAIALAFALTLIFLVIFEITKRYFIRNFSHDFVVNAKKVGFKLMSWFMISITIVALSFYLSITGSKKLATTSSVNDVVALEKTTSEIDSLRAIFDERKSVYLDDNRALRTINNDLREKLASTPLNYRTVRNEYQVSIDKNSEVITENETKIDIIDTEFEARVKELNLGLDETKTRNQDEDTKNILLFIVIVVFNELIIIGGLYFREYFEYNLFIINQEKYEKIYRKKDRYRALISFIYRDGKLTSGDKVMPGHELKEIVKDKTSIPNSSKFVDEFLRDMDTIGIFVIVGKRRNIRITYVEALDTIENYDDTYRVLENMK
jgi:hypothetical protein